MKYLLFNWDTVDFPKSANSDPSNLTDKEFEELCIKDENGFVLTEEDFQAGFNSEFFSTHTHQLRIVNQNKDE
jgi:hypothetical protein